jgi:hypothetical protein
MFRLFLRVSTCNDPTSIKVNKEDSVHPDGVIQQDSPGNKVDSIPTTNHDHKAKDFVLKDLVVHLVDNFLSEEALLHKEDIDSNSKFETLECRCNKLPKFSNLKPFLLLNRQ